MAWGKSDQPLSDSHTADTSKAGFFSSFGLKKKELHVKKTDEKRLTKSRAPPRGGKQALPAFTVIRPQRSFSNRPASGAKPAPAFHASAAPSIFLDDPAFSSDPRAHPLFSAASDVNSRRSFAARSQVSQPRHSGGSGRSRAQASRAQNRSIGTDDIQTADFALLSPPKIPHAPSTSSRSSDSSTTKTSSVEAHTTPGTSPNSSAENAPMTAKLKKFSVVNPEESRPDLPRSTSSTSNPPPPYEASIEVSLERSQEDFIEASPRPNATRGSSAPELHHPPPQIVMPPRPATALAEDRLTAPPLQRRTETVNTQGGTRTRELDRIDELDESDPFGAAIHHRGPYEAIQAILGNTSNNVGGHEGGGAERGPERKPKPQPTTYAQPYPGMPMFDPYMKLNLKPGQILPRIPFYDPGTLPQTPYHRQHRSVSAVPSQPPSVTSPRRNKSERTPQPPQHRPREHHHVTQSDVGHGQNPSSSRHPQTSRELQPQRPPKNFAPPHIRIDTSPSQIHPDQHQPLSQHHLQPLPHQPHARTRSQSEQGHSEPLQRPLHSHSDHGHQLMQRPQQYQAHSPVVQHTSQPASSQAQQQSRPQQYQLRTTVEQQPSLQAPSQPQPSQQQPRPQQYQQYQQQLPSLPPPAPPQPSPPQPRSQVHTQAPQPPILFDDSRAPQQQRRPLQYQTPPPEQQHQQQYQQQSVQAHTQQQPQTQTRSRHQSEHSRSQPRPSDHGHHELNAIPHLLVPGQSLSSSHSSRQSSQAPSIAPGRSVSTSHSSQRSAPSSRSVGSQSALTPLHVPKRLVMPSPLAPSNVPLAQGNQYTPASIYQPPLPKLPPPPPPQQPQFPLAPLQNQNIYRPMGEEVLMTTEAQKLLRKRTASQPANAPMHVPLGEMRLQQSNTNVHFLPPLYKKERPTEGRLDKSGKRLSKRRVVV